MRSRLRLNAFGLLSLTTLLWATAVESPVADAAMRGDLEAVRELLRAGADVNAAQGDGMTALHWAASRDDAEMIEVLAYAGAAVEATTRLGAYTPLHLASRAGATAAVRALLGVGSSVEAATTSGVTPLHFSAEAGDADGVRVLVEAGADVNAVESFAARTPLMFAVAADRRDAVAALLGAGADVTATTRVVDFAERSEKDDAERRIRDRVMAAARGEEPEAEDRTGQVRQTAGAAQPASGGVGPGKPDTSAAAPHEPEPAAAPAQDPDSPTRPDPVPAAGPDPDAPTRPEPPAGPMPDPDSPTAPWTGPGEPPPDGKRPEPPEPMGYDDLVGKQGGLTALHYAARDGRIEVARQLLDSGAEVDAVTLGDRSSPLLVSIINGNYDLAMMLLERGADPTLTSEDGAGPLFATLNSYWALRTWHPQPTAWQQQETHYLELMRALLEAGAEVNARVNQHIWYAAYNAGRMGVDFAGATAFWRAAYSLDVDAMRLLAEYGADPDVPTVKPPEGRRRGLPGQGANPDEEEEEEDPSGLPPVEAGGPAVHPLHAASGVGYGTSRVGQQHRHVPDGWLPAVRFLIEEMGVDVNVRDHDGYSAVHNAAARGDNDVILYLVDQGADVTFVSRRGQTTVDMANGPQQRVQPFPETILLLESLGAKNNDNCLSC